MIKTLSLLAFATFASAGLAPAPVAYHAPIAAAPVAYAHPAPVLAAAPVAYHAPAIAKVHHAAPAVFAAPVVKAAVAVAPEPFDPNPSYNYGYSIQDGLTGDAKSHTETREGDVVRGSYSLVEPDGAIRTVHYTADDVHGFNAVVDRQAPQVAVAKVHAAPVVHAAPAVAAYAAPIAHKVHAAPVAYAAAAPLAYKHHL